MSIILKTGAIFTNEELFAIPADGDGWRLLPDGNWASIGYYGASIGDGARIGNGASIGDGASIGNGASENGVEIGVGSSVKAE